MRVLCRATWPRCACGSRLSSEGRPERKSRSRLVIGGRYGFGGARHRSLQVISLVVRLASTG
eukprot:9088768-Pyramimonas_sp.AAC.1